MCIVLGFLQSQCGYNLWMEISLISLLYAHLDVKLNGDTCCEMMREHTRHLTAAERIWMFLSVSGAVL